MLTLKFTYKANQDLRRLRAFIAEKNPAAAKRVSELLRNGINGHPWNKYMSGSLEAVTDYLAKRI